jgi:hypothetical protein
MEENTEEKALHDGGHGKRSEEQQQNGGVRVLDDVPVLKNQCPQY